MFSNSKKNSSLRQLACMLRSCTKPHHCATSIFAAIALDTQITLLVVRISSLYRLSTSCTTTRPIIKDDLLEQHLASSAIIPLTTFPNHWGALRVAVKVFVVEVINNATNTLIKHGLCSIQVFFLLHVLLRAC